MAASVHKADFDPSSGLRGVCATLIVVGHFFDLYAPASFRYFGFNSTVAGCDGSASDGMDPRTRPECYPTKAMDEVYPIVSVMYLTPVTLFFVISGALFAYLYYDQFHNISDPSFSEPTLSSTKPVYKSKVTLYGFLAKRYWRIVPILWVSLAWLAPFFFSDKSITMDIKIMNLVIAPTPLFVLQPLILLGVEWNAIMWQVSNLFLCYAFVPPLFAALKSDAIARARCPTRSPHFRKLVLRARWADDMPGGTMRLLQSRVSAMFASLRGITGVGFWLWWIYSTAMYWLIYYTWCDETCIKLSIGEAVTHMLIYFRLPHFILGFYVGLALKEEELVETLLDPRARPADDLTERAALTRASGGKLLPVAPDAALATYGRGRTPRSMRVLIVDGLFFGWMGTVGAVVVFGDFTGATRSVAYDFDNQFWLAPLHCLWLYHAARLAAPDPPAHHAYASLEEDAGGGSIAPVPSTAARRSLAAAFLRSRPMLKLGELSYGMYICQLGALNTASWVANGFSIPQVASWLNQPSAAWGQFTLEPWAIVPVLLLLTGVVQLAELALAPPKPPPKVAPDSSKRPAAGASTDAAAAAALTNSAGAVPSVPPAPPVGSLEA